MIEKFMKKNHQKILLDIAKYTIKQLLPEKLLQPEIKKLKIQKYKKIYIFGIGKAAKTMTKATQKTLAKAKPTIALADEGHPLPTKNGLKKTGKIISLAKKLTKNDLAIVLISGGGSAMFTKSAANISLEDKVDLTKKLLKCGATINEINTVRKHISQVKGGNFAKLLYPAKVYAYVISDVIGNDLSIIASGPLSPDPSTFKEALSILKKYKITPSGSIQKHLENGLKNKEPETPKTKEKFFKNIKIKVISDHTTSANFAFKKAAQLKLNGKIISTSLSGESRVVAQKFVKTLHKSHKNTLLIATGETTVTIQGRGFGGRNQELVLAALPHLKENQTILSIGTDGVDGICPQKTAGAIADQETLRKAKSNHLDPIKYLQNNDSYTFFKKVGGQIKTGPTGTNVGDLILLLNS